MTSKTVVKPVTSYFSVAAYKTIIIILCIAVVLVPLIVGVLVFIFKHKFDMQKMKEEQSRM